MRHMPLILKRNLKLLGRFIGNGEPPPPPPCVRACTPKCKADVQRLLGMVNYLAKFLPGLSDMCLPLRQLTQQDNDWYWDVDQENAHTT